MKKENRHAQIAHGKILLSSHLCFFFFVKKPIITLHTARSERKFFTSDITTMRKNSSKLSATTYTVEFNKMNEFQRP